MNYLVKLAEQHHIIIVQTSWFVHGSKQEFELAAMYDGDFKQHVREWLDSLEYWDRWSM